MRSKVERVELEIGARMRGHRLPLALPGTQRRGSHKPHPCPDLSHLDTPLCHSIPSRVILWGTQEPGQDRREHTFYFQIILSSFPGLELPKHCFPLMG